MDDHKWSSLYSIHNGKNVHRKIFNEEGECKEAKKCGREVCAVFRNESVTPTALQNAEVPISLLATFKARELIIIGCVG